MTYKDFLDYLKEYKAALLNIIPDFYEEEDISHFPSITNLSGKTYFKSTEMLNAKIKVRKSTPLKNPEDEAKRKKELYSLKEGLKQNKRWIAKCSGFIEYMTNYVLMRIDPIAKECTPLLFRFRFFDEEIAASIYSQKAARAEFKKSIQRGLDNGKDEDMAFSIFIEFMVYLKLLKDKYDKYEISAIIKRKMDDQEENYLDVSGDIIKEYLGSDEEKSIVRSVAEIVELKERQEELSYAWSVNDCERMVLCNGQHIAKLPPLQFKLFECLYKKKDKYVKNKAIEKCWEGAKVGRHNLTTTMGKLNKKLEEGLSQNNIKIKSRVVEPKKENMKNVSYKLAT